MKAVYRVTQWEMERGWGRSHWGDTDFDGLEAARDFVRDERAKNTEPTAPDWYILTDDPVLVDAELSPPRA